MVQGCSRQLVALRGARPLFVIGRSVHEEKFAAGAVDNGPIGHFMGALAEGVRARGGLWLAQVKLEGAFVDENALMVAQLGDGF